MTGEGSLDAPTREIIRWQDPDFTDPVKLDAEMRRVFDICHGCRRCFNLCDSFPRLFDLIDSNPDRRCGRREVGRFRARGRSLHALRHVLHDQMPLRAAASLQCSISRICCCARAPPKPKPGKKDFTQGQLAEMDRNGTLARFASPMINWASDTSNKPMRAVMEKVAAYRSQGRPCQNSTAGHSFRPTKGDPIVPNRGSASLRQAQGRALCHLLCQLQPAHHRHGGAERAQSYRRGNHRLLSRLLRHAVPGAGRTWRAWRKTPPRFPRNWSS